MLFIPVTDDLEIGLFSVFDGNGYTFLGVLVTLSVLCVLTNDSNVIIGLLKDIAPAVVKHYVTRRRQLVESETRGGLIREWVKGGDLQVLDEAVGKWGKEPEKCTPHETACGEAVNALRNHLDEQNTIIGGVKVDHKAHMTTPKNVRGLWGDYFDRIFGEVHSAHLKTLSDDVTDYITAAPFFTVLFAVTVFVAGLIVAPFIVHLSGHWVIYGNVLLFLLLSCFTLLSLVFWGDHWVSWRKGARTGRTRIARWLGGKVSSGNAILHSAAYFSWLLLISAVLAVILTGLLAIWGVTIELCSIRMHTLGTAILLFAMLNGLILPFYIPHQLYRKYCKQGTGERDEEADRTKEKIKKQILDAVKKINEGRETKHF